MTICELSYQPTNKNTYISRKVEEAKVEILNGERNVFLHSEETNTCITIHVQIYKREAFEIMK